MVKIIVAAIALLALRADSMDYSAVFLAPPTNVPTKAMPDGPLLGNGDLGVTLAGPPELQSFYIGKNDFWVGDSNSFHVTSVGCLQVSIPDLQGASYRQDQPLLQAEVRGQFAKPGLAVRLNSWVQADRNLLLTELQFDGANPLPVTVRPVPAIRPPFPNGIIDTTQTVNIGREQYGRGRWYFDGEIADVIITNVILPALPPGPPVRSETFDGQTTWRAVNSPKVDQVITVAAWIKIARTNESRYVVSKGGWNDAYSLGLCGGRLRWAINGRCVQTENLLEAGKWLYVAGTFDGSRIRLYVDGKLTAEQHWMVGLIPGGFTCAADSLPGPGHAVAVVARVVGAGGLEFVLQPKQRVTIATAVESGGDADDSSGASRRLVAALSPPKIEHLKDIHEKWWNDFWTRSSIEIPDKTIEEHWYAALYVMGSCSRPGKVAPGLWGNWPTVEYPAWQGDYTLNYNFQAPFYIVYSANHPELSLPFYQAIEDAVPAGRALARQHGWQGIYLPTHIGPWGMLRNGPHFDWGQRSDAAYAALNFIWYWQYTQDRAWLKDVGYPYLRGVAAFWEDYLKFENGRYVIYNDSIHENSGPDMNGLLSLGLVRALFNNLISMSSELGVDNDRRPRWQTILDKLSPYPLQTRNGRTVFRYTESGIDWREGNTLGIQHIFPAGTISLGSDPKLLALARDMITEMHRWHDGNGFSSWYTACARVGYDPNTILDRLRQECDRWSMPNLLLRYQGGGIENVSGFLAVNEMLLQSHEGVLRFFPCWPRDQDARFCNLRAVGAFVVSAEIKDGRIRGVQIISEQGRDCTVQNPWPGHVVAVIKNGAAGESRSGETFTFKTSVGATVSLLPRP